MLRSLVRFVGKHKLPELPYSTDALQPYISAETLRYHYGKHHAAYVSKLNQLIEANPSLKNKSLEELIKTENGAVFNQAAQIWNHTFYWHCLKPGGGGDPTGPIKNKIIEDFGNFKTFKDRFSACAAGHFGSGWAWLVMNNKGELDVVGGHDAVNPLKDGSGLPILTCDVWEHAYYLDYRNERPKYIESWWNLVNWDFANSNLKSAKL